MERVDYIIVGQGIAGSAVAAQLLKRGKRICVFDTFDKNSSSHVAAGLFNPVTGIKMIKTWQADVLFDYLHAFYPEVERITGVKFFHSKEIYRPFNSVAEQNEWMGSSVDENLQPLIERTSTKPLYSDVVHDPYGGMMLRKSGYVDTSVFLKAVRNLIQQKGILVSECFDERELIYDDRSVQYRNYHADRIIFCQGEINTSSRFFRCLPIIPLKGETLTIKASFVRDVIVNSGIYIVPCGEDMWRVGSTYNRAPFEREITQHASEELQGKLNSLMKAPYTILSQDFGIRPSSRDRKPIIGVHPKIKTICIFNGLGTKGISLAPYFSNVLIEAIENGGAINKEVDISRYISLNWNSGE